MNETDKKSFGLSRLLGSSKLTLVKRLFFSVVPNVNHTLNRTYFLENTALSPTISVRDLGVLIDTHLNFHDHINNIVTKAHQRCGIFFRGFISRDLILARKVFITYIRPILEYNSRIWNPSSIQYVDLIEGVQRRFTKRIPSLTLLPYGTTRSSQSRTT